MTFQSHFKPTVPLALERHHRKAARKALAESHSRDAKRRDGGNCRWPKCEFRKVVQPIDAAHVFRAKGMGGDPTGIRTERKLLLSLCRCHHRLQEKHELDIEALTPALADGPCSFWDNRGPQRYLVAMERAIGILERD